MKSPCGRDVTEQRKLELSVAQNEQRMELGLAGAELGLWDLDLPSGNFTNNPRLLTMIGYTPGEVKASSKSFLTILHIDDAAEFGAAFFAHLKGETANFEAECRLRHKDDNWILCRGKVVERDSGGRAVRMTGTNLDISQRKRSEAALKAREARRRH